MNRNEIERGLTEGLLAGYGGKTEFTGGKREGFPTKRSHLERPGILYDDEWLAAQTGGGQELLHIGNERFTRLYAGGIIPHEKLSALGVTEKDIIGHLITSIQTLGDKTRLFEDCPPQTTGNWTYEYQILQRYGEIELTVGEEKISYQGQTVFTHVFLLTPIRLS